MACGDSTEAIHFTGNFPGIVYTWTNNDTTIGLPGSGTGDIPAFLPVNNTSGSVTATITVTPSAGGAFKILFVYTDVSVPPVTLGNQLLAMPEVTQVDYFDGGLGTPALAQLQQYDIVVHLVTVNGLIRLCLATILRIILMGRA